MDQTEDESHLSDGDESIDTKPPKRQKVESRGLFKPPTKEELHILSDSSVQQQSTLFKLQAEEMTKEMEVTGGKKKAISEAVDQLRKVLFSLKEIEVDNVSHTSWLPPNIKVPWKWKGHNVKGAIKLQKPIEIEIAGSFPLETCSKSSLNVDVILKMPSTVIHAKDYLNFRYHHKRSLYIAYVASHLDGHKMVENLSYTFSNGDHLRPLLAVNLTGKHLKKVTFKLHPCPSDSAFRLQRFAPTTSNIRSQWYQGSQDEEEKFPATPHYNASILRDVCMDRHLKYLLEVSRGFPSFKESVMMMGVWLHQRELDKGPGAFSPFLAAMLISYLIQEKRLSKRMMSQQIVKGTLNYLAHSDWTEHGITLTPEGAESSLSPPIDEFHSAYEVVFVDQTGFLNLCAEMTRNTYKQVKFEASCTLNHLNDFSSDSFEVLCMTSMPFTRKYDQMIQVRDLSWLKAYCKNLKMEDSLMERKGVALFVILDQLLALMEKALGNRIRSIAMKPLEVPMWPIYGSTINYSSLPNITFGLLLNDEYSFNVLDKGPNADSPEAAEFKAFWGKKSEMRRFHDGSIREAVLWPGESLASKRLTPCHVVTYILEKHVGVPPRHIAVVADQLDGLLKPGKCVPWKEMASLGTGEELHIEVMAAYQELSKYLRQLKDIPLGIASVQGISPVFRHTEVFPPMRALRSQGAFNKERRLVMPSVNKPGSEFVPCCRVVCQLEDSGKWPDSVPAIQKIKTAFYIKIAELLKKQFRISSVPTEKFLDVLQGGFVFRIEVAHTKELGLLKKGRSTLGHLVLQENKASMELEKRTVALPRLTNALHGVYQDDKSFGLTARLAKRWVAAQLLSGHVPDEAVELMVAFLYLHPAPFTPPKTLVSGFQRFLHLLSSFDWANRPMIVNLNGDLQEADFEEIHQHFSNNRSLLPNMCIVTPTERNSMWTQEQPTKLILHRLQILARESSKCLGKAVLGDSTHEDLKQIFRPPIDSYDAIIHLDKTVGTRRRQAVDASDDVTLTVRQKSPEETSDVIPTVNFDPVKLYVKGLEDAFSDHAMFFYDEFGGNFIAVKWNTPAFTAKPTQVSSMVAATPNTASPNILTTVVPNVEGILSDFQVIGDGLVKSMEVFPDNWKIK